MCEMLDQKVTRLEPDGTITLLWERDETKKGGPNDIVFSSKGNAYFTVPRHGCVYRIAQDASISVVASDLPGINGVMLSQDETYLFVTEFKNRRVLRMPLEEAGTSSGKKELFTTLPKPEEDHGADGMATDTENRLYVACKEGVWIFDADGSEAGVIPLPGEKVTNCVFGGTDGNTLFITTRQGLFSARRIDD